MDLADTRVSLAGKGATTGTATSTVTAGVASVDVGGIIVTAQVAQGLTLAVGDVVLIIRTGSVYWVISKVFTAPPAPPVNDPPPPPKPTVTTGTLVVAPVYTGSYRAGKWRTDSDDVIQGVTPGQANSTGAVFYGSKPRSLSGATVTKATIRVKRIRGGGFADQLSTMRLVTQSTKPSGAPTLTSTSSGPNIAVNETASAFVIPTSWAQSMVDGTAGGLGFFDASGSPYIRFAGRGAYSPAFTLTISWKR